MLSLTLFIIVLNLSLGVAILLQTKRSFDAATFFFITLAFSLLSAANYFAITTNLDKALYWIRFEMFFAAIHTFLFFVFVHIFTKESYPYSLKRSLVFAGAFLVILWISLSPYLFSGIELSTATNSVETLPGKFFPIYAFWLFGTMLLSMRKVVKTYKHSEGTLREQWKYMLYGSFTTYLALIIFNFVFAAFFHNTTMLKYTPLYSLPIVIATAYAIINHNLFNMKILATEAFVSILVVVFFAKIIISETIADRIVETMIFTATALFGMFLVRSVKEEVRANEEVRVLAKRLTESNWELARTNERLRIIDQRKSEFVSIVSHQLRTPITAIKGYASMILEKSYGNVPESLNAPIEKIFLSSKRLAEMVNDFLDLSKIEQGKMSYNFTSVNIKKMLEDIEEEFSPIAKKKGLILIFEAGGDDGFTVTADEGKIRQIFTNLIDNSIKYTPSGSVAISLEKNNKEGKVIVRIKDTGIGLSQDDIHHLFGKFARGEGGQKQFTDGSGLGLYVAKKMIEAHHGKIWVDSPGIGKGSEFAVELLHEEHI